MGSNSKIQGYKVYSMLHFCRKFSSGITTLLLENIDKDSSPTFPLAAHVVKLKFRLENTLS